MPKERIYTEAGYIEVSWYGGGGGLVCIDTLQEDIDGEVSRNYHQITDKGSVSSLLKVLRRAKRQEFPSEVD